MRHISTTPPGRRTQPAGLTPAVGPATAPCPSADKWALLQALTDGRDAFGLTDRNLAVLSALLSFYPARDLRVGAPTVFPSNASLSSRLHGMPESTLRRHLSALVAAGMIRRQDSPNGKRYATRDGNGRIDHVFGFDLRPLLQRAAEIAQAADRARARARHMRRLRQTISLLMRDAAMLSDGVAPCQARLADLQRLMRRKLDLDALTDLESRLRRLLADMARQAEPAPEMSANDSQNERHHHNTDSDILESEEGPEQDELPPLAAILKAAPEIETYAAAPLRSWRDLVGVAEFIRPMLGITAETWAFARRSMGEGRAAVVLSCILQRFASIRNPGAYLRRLAQSEDFRVGPMVMALLRNRDAVAASS